MNKFLLLLFFTCLLSACKNASSQNAGFTINAPAGWTKSDTLLMGTNITILRSPEEENDDFIENVNVIAENVGGFSLGEYYEKSLAIMKSQLHDFSQGQLAKQKINGIDFKNLKYQHNYNGRILDVDVYFAVKGRTGYVITCTAAKGTLSKWQASFDKIINSFSFI